MTEKFYHIIIEPVLQWASDWSIRAFIDLCSDVLSIPVFLVIIAGGILFSAWLIKNWDLKEWR
ncbi:MAG: hypothetical protein ACYTE8_00360 [Planctomycetota bacterium]|jgi:hypothetical protein